MIKSKTNSQGKTVYYYISKETGDEVDLTSFDPDKPNAPVKIYKSNAEGKFKLTDLTDGYYRIIEPEAPEYETGKKYMKVNGPIKRFRVVQGKVRIFDKDKDGKIVEKEVDKTNIGTLGKIVNKKPGKGEFKLTKLDENNNPMEKVEYTLHDTDANETQVGDAVYTTNSDGQIHFKDLPFGYYWLKETKTLNGYILDTKKKLIALGGDKWKVPETLKDDVSEAITFDGTQDELVSTAEKPNKSTVYPNKAEGIFAKYKFKIDPKTTIKAGDYFTIHFSDNVDLDGIYRDKDGIGKMPNDQLNIIGPAGLLAKAKVNDDRRSITYTFTNYVDEYKPDFMSMYLQLFPNRRKVDHTQNITVTAHIGDKTDTTSSDFNYSDSINIDYRGENSYKDANGNTVTYNGYQNPNTAISSYMLRLDPEQKTFTAILYLNPWNSTIWNKKLSFTTDKYIKINDKLSVKTYVKTGSGSNKDGWQNGNLPDSYDINEDNLQLVSDSQDDYNVYAKRTYTEVSYYDGYDYSIYDYSARRYRYYKVTKDNTLTDRIELKNSVINKNIYPRNATYVIEIKGELEGEAQSLETKSEAIYDMKNAYTGYVQTHTDNFKTWSQFFNPGASGDANKEIKLVNFKNKIEFAKVDGGVLATSVDKSLENPESLKGLGLGNALNGATFKLQIKNTSGEWVDSGYGEKTSVQDGIFSWEGLKEGSYRVKETKTPDDTKYDLPTKALATFDVDKNGNIVNIVPENYILENYRTAKIKLKKTDQDGNGLQGAEFTLEPKSGQKDPNDLTKNFPTKTLTSTKDGTVESDNLPAGKYELKEEKAPKGYTKSETVWNLEVTKDGKVKWLNSFDDTNDKMKAVTVNSYSGDSTTPTNLNSEILGIDEANKTFRQKITIKAKPSELEKARLILDSVKSDLKLSQTNTKVRLVQAKDSTILKPDNTSYTVEINNGTSPNNLTLKITPPYREEKKNNPVGSENGQAGEPSQDDADAEREYQFIVDMPYADDGRLGAKATYDVGLVDKNTGKVTFETKESSTSLDKYATKGNYTIGTTNVVMTTYENKYLARDINLITTDIGNIKKPSIYFEKVDADNNATKLKDAVFELQKEFDGKYEPINTNGEKAGLLDKWTEKSDKDGHFGFSNIPDGEYQIFETKAPDGYALVEKIVFKFVVENGKIEYKEENYKNNPKIEVKLEKENEENSENNRFLITNKKAQYPSTGGPGVWIGFTVIGMLVMFVAVLTYWKRRDKLKV